jgi:hypothetical protein
MIFVILFTEMFAASLAHTYNIIQITIKIKCMCMRHVRTPLWQPRQDSRRASIAIPTSTQKTDIDTKMNS